MANSSDNQVGFNGRVGNSTQFSTSKLTSKLPSSLITGRSGQQMDSKIKAKQIFQSVTAYQKQTEKDLKLELKIAQRNMTKVIPQN